MTKSIPEPSRDIPVLDEVEVLVAGGGLAGCAAAVAAARAGARTMLLERNGCLGGVATATLMANIGNRYLTASGERVVRGFAGELVDRLAAAGAASPHWEHRDVPGCVIDSERLKVVLIDLLQEAGVTTLTHALAARPIMDGPAVKGVFIESKSGRQAILAKGTVDATGEADLAFQAGAEVTMTTGTARTLFKLGNVDLDAFVEFLCQDPDGFPAGMDWVKDVPTFGRNWKERGVLFFPHGGGGKWRFFQEAVESGEFEKSIGPAMHLDALGMYAIRGNGCIVINSNFYRIEDLDVRRLSEFELHAQKMCYYVGEFLKKKVRGFERAYVAHVGVDLGIRVSRAIVGRTALKKECLVDPPGPCYADDVIAVTAALDTQREGGEFFRDFSCDVPFGVTVPRGITHLLVGSAKSIDTEHPGLIRGMSGCMICGQATGVASAVGAASNLAPAEVPVREIQRELIRQGANLGSAERLAALGLT